MHLLQQKNARAHFEGGHFRFRMQIDLTGLLKNCQRERKAFIPEIYQLINLRFEMVSKGMRANSFRPHASIYPNDLFEFPGSDVVDFIRIRFSLRGGVIRRSTGAAEP